MPLLFLLAFVALVALAWRTHQRWLRGQDECAGRVGGFRRTGQEQRGLDGNTPPALLDVLLAMLAGSCALQGAQEVADACPDDAAEERAESAAGSVLLSRGGVGMDRIDRSQDGVLLGVEDIVVVEAPSSRQPGGTAAHPGQMASEQHLGGRVPGSMLLNEENERLVLQAAQGRVRSGLQGEHGSGARLCRVGVNSLIAPPERLGGGGWGVGE